MTKQSFGRSVPVVSRDTSAVERTTSADPSWYSGFVAALDKQSVKSRQQDYSLFEQISSMMTHKSKYSTVDEAVDDFKKRTGLDKYLTSLAQQSPIIDNETPISQQTQDLFQQVPGLKEYMQTTSMSILEPPSKQFLTTSSKSAPSKKLSRKAPVSQKASRSSSMRRSLSNKRKATNKVIGLVELPISPMMRILTLITRFLLSNRLASIDNPVLIYASASNILRCHRRSVGYVRSSLFH